MSMTNQHVHDSRTGCRRKVSKNKSKAGPQPGVWGSLSKQPLKYKGAEQGTRHRGQGTRSELE